MKKTTDNKQVIKKSILRDGTQKSDEVLPIPENLIGMSEITWALSKVCLWPFKEFNTYIITETKRKMRLFLNGSHNVYNRYQELCQRILIAWETIRHSEISITGNPEAWFMGSRIAEFKWTASKFEALQQMRNTKPLHRHEWKALAEAMLEMLEESTETIAEYWINWFRERKAFEEEKLFACLFIKI